MHHDHRVLFVVPDVGSNHMNRLRSLCLICDQIGWGWHVAGPSATGAIWQPLAGTPRWTEQTTITDGSKAALSSLAKRARLVVACKPMPECLLPAKRVARQHRLPLMIDIDDPDFDVRRAVYAQPQWKRLGKLPRRLGRLAKLAMAERLTRTLPGTTSNPMLQQRYGGIIVPHAIEDTGPGAPHVNNAPTVAFVGTVREHKGIDSLRRAVASIQDAQPVCLKITADAPADAKPWEQWLGTVSIESAHRLTAEADIMALPSIAVDYGTAQLPAKLLAGMMLGRAVIASDLPPIRWALADTGLLVEPGSTEALTEALTTLCDPQKRASFGKRARERALTMFTPAACAAVVASLFDQLTGSATPQAS
ncbi:glycosyltransferase family 4 protein [Phycisphaerales bacterium AB-hyl4]|uniref:Glycosyltransferase family 4 protein n=1 Tax=Natronomicrosphaera hydrolytica TaxID=3242702 RepID=A0ABV4U1N2_9BACT